jgi:hypothetical protein
MAGQALSRGQRQALSGRVLGSVGRLVDDMGGLEVLPQEMGRIRQAAGREGVPGQQIAEFVKNPRQRFAGPGHQRQARGGGQKQQSGQEQ